jgi:hypothetical protein
MRMQWGMRIVTAVTATSRSTVRLVDDVHVERDGHGTTVVMRKRGSWSGSTT